MTFIARTKREHLLLDALKAATTGARGSASVCNYSVYEGECEIEFGLSRDEAIGYARGHSGIGYGGNVSDPTVRCGAFVVWPEDRYGELIGDDGGEP